MTTSSDADKWRFTPPCKTVEEGDAILARVARVLAPDDCEDVWWRVDGGIITTMIKCNDVFWWGTADCEAVTPDNVELLEETFWECKEKCEYTSDASLLFVARVRNMRPQGAFYKNFDADYVKLFDAAGPPREKNPLLDPVERP